MLAWLVAVQGVAAASDRAEWESLQQSGAIVSAIEIVIQDVFDLKDPQQDHLVGRLANLVHIDSRARVVRNDLLFKTGVPVDAQLIYASERLLRSRSIFRQARIDPVPGSDNTVTARVVVADAWSLKVDVGFKHEGGDQTYGIKIEEGNLMGLGKKLALGYGASEERTDIELGYQDPAVLGSRWELKTGYAELSDGHQRLLRITRPFDTLTSPFSTELSALSNKYDLRRYDLGDEIGRLPGAFDPITGQYWRALAHAGDSVLRMGVEYRFEKAEYGTPSGQDPQAFDGLDIDSRELHGFLLRVRWLEEQFASVENLNIIGRVEDINFGWEFETAIGRYAKMLGADRDGWMGSVAIGKRWRLWPDAIVKLDAKAEGRVENGRWKNLRYGSEVLLFDQRLRAQTLAARLAFDGVLQPAPESLLYLGAEQGLRGYVNRFKAGDRRWCLSFEDRVVTDWALWGIAQIGFIGYLDVGGIHSLSDDRWGRTYANLGGGFRIGNLKSAFGRVVLATLSFPLVKEEGVNDAELFLGAEIPF